MIKEVATFIQALTTGTLVSKEIQDERIATCMACRNLRRDRFNANFCGLCGCQVANRITNVLNITAYEEELPKWGCKHPLRKKGHGWKR